MTSAAVLPFSADQVAVISGASSGLGRGTAVKLAQKGITKFCLTARNREGLEETRRICIEQAANKTCEQNFVIVAGKFRTKFEFYFVQAREVFLISGDITEQSVCEQIVNETISKLGRIDILFNNAGMAAFGTFEQVPMEAFDRILDVNLKSAVMLSRMFIPHLKKSKGVILNNSSIGASSPIVSSGYYCISKAALDMFTQCLALEMAPSGVRVNSVNPGIVNTGIHGKAGLPKEMADAFMAKCEQIHPLGRTATVEEVSNLVAFLASSESSFMTGVNAHISGGLNIRDPFS